MTVSPIKAKIAEVPMINISHQGNFKTSDVPKAPTNNNERFINVLETIRLRASFQKFSLILYPLQVYLKTGWRVKWFVIF